MVIVIITVLAVIAAEILIKRRIEEKGDEYGGQILGGQILLRKNYNPGLLFGFLGNRKILANILNGTLLCGVFVYTLIRSIHGMGLLARIGWALILGGGLSNLTERMRVKHVTDYFSFIHAFPKRLRRLVFNVADVCIFVGAVLAVLFDR